MPLMTGRRRVLVSGLIVLGVALLVSASVWGEPLTMVIVYTGLLTMPIGVICLIKPLRFLRLRRRRIAAVVVACGLATVVVVGLLPTHLHRIDRPSTALDSVLAAYQFNEFHSTRVQASPARAFAAVKSVTPREIRLLQTLIAIRSLGQADLPERESMLATMNDSGYPTLVERPDREVVLGGAFRGSGPAPDVDGADAFVAADGPGLVKVAFNFVVRDVGGGYCEVTTETRVFATDPSGRRAFAPYWRVIYPGSWLLRVTWLDAIKERAEQAR